jgi:hypothetical protein
MGSDACPPPRRVSPPLHHARPMPRRILLQPTAYRIQPRVSGLFLKKPPKTGIAPTHARHASCNHPPQLFSPIVTLDLYAPARNLRSEERMIAAKCMDFDVLTFRRFDVLCHLMSPCTFIPQVLLRFPTGSGHPEARKWNSQEVFVEPEKAPSHVRQGVQVTGR